MGHPVRSEGGGGRRQEGTGCWVTEEGRSANTIVVLLQSKVKKESIAERHQVLTE